MDRTNTICSVLESIYKRPGMYFRYHNDFKIYASYVSGFLFGMCLIHHFSLQNLSRAFADQYNQGKGSDIILESLVSDVVHRDDTDEVKIETYMSFLIGYFEKNDCEL